jgi:hypothetical protein
LAFSGRGLGGDVYDVSGDGVRANRFFVVGAGERIGRRFLSVAARVTIVIVGSNRGKRFRRLSRWLASQGSGKPFAGAPVNAAAVFTNRTCFGAQISDSHLCADDFAFAEHPVGKD